MTWIRAEKVARLANVIPKQDVYGNREGKLLVVGWGSTFGAIRTAVEQAQKGGRAVSHAHIRYLNPFPSNLGKILGKFDRVLVPEMNMGQLSLLLRGKYDANIISYGLVQGRPFKVSEIRAKIEEFTGK
jgi:2-oxoglutarate ferredoxin oxidoreductase subunit alpha